LPLAKLSLKPHLLQLLAPPRPALLALALVPVPVLALVLLQALAPQLA